MLHIPQLILHSTAVDMAQAWLSHASAASAMTDDVELCGAAATLTRPSDCSASRLKGEIAEHYLAVSCCGICRDRPC